MGQLASALVSSQVGSPQRRQLSELLICELQKVKAQSHGQTDDDDMSMASPGGVVPDDSDSDVDSQFSQVFGETMAAADSAITDMKSCQADVGFSVEEVLDFFDNDEERELHLMAARCKRARPDSQHTEAHPLLDDEFGLCSGRGGSAESIMLLDSADAFASPASPLLTPSTPSSLLIECAF